MLSFVLAYLGGVLTILSPCILPVVPFVFVRAGRPFRQNGLPMLAGMALTFAAVATLSVAGGAWAVRANQYGRAAAMVFFAVVGLSLVSAHVAAWIARPFVAIGSKVQQRAETETMSVTSSVGLGVATGLLWAPCAGPILGLLLTRAALNGASVRTALLLFTFAAGTATALACVLFAGGKVAATATLWVGAAGEWFRRGLGALVLADVAAIALGLDTGVLAQLSPASTAGIEQRLIDSVRPAPPPKGRVVLPPAAPPSPSPKGAADVGSLVASWSQRPEDAEALPIEGELPSLARATQWLNSEPLTPDLLHGKVVLVDFWTYSCINCIRSLPYVEAWARKYRDAGLVVIGVHTPEFAFEKDAANVAKAVRRLGVDYPVALDNDYAIWKSFNNEYWPAHYFIDTAGHIRHHHFGEGGYVESEDVIRRLLTEAGREGLPRGYVRPGAPEVAGGERSPETYVGYARATNFAGGALARDTVSDYRAPEALGAGGWALDGRWLVCDEHARLEESGGRILYRFRGRDLHLVLGPGSAGTPVRFRVRLDGTAPGADHGTDVDGDGRGTVTDQRLYQLVHQANATRERLFEIEFFDPGVQAYAFTFG